MAEQIKAPWTPEQVEALNAYQRAGVFHPFTCANRDHSPHIGDGLLVALATEWICTDCFYTQDWAWDWMADEARWRALDWRRLLPRKPTQREPYCVIQREPGRWIRKWHVQVGHDIWVVHRWFVSRYRAERFGVLSAHRLACGNFNGFWLDRE